MIQILLKPLLETSKCFCLFADRFALSVIDISVQQCCVLCVILWSCCECEWVWCGGVTLCFVHQCLIHTESMAHWVGALKFLEAGLSLTVEIRELDLEVEPSWTECHTHTKHRAEVFCLYCYRLHKPHHTTEDTYIETVFICSKSRLDRQQDRHINRPSDWGARILFQNLYIIGLSKFWKKESSAPVTGLTYRVVY